MVGWLAAMWLGCAPPNGTVEPPPEVTVNEPAAPASDPDLSQLPDPTEPRYGARHILIAWAGAPRSTATRSESDAEALARRLHREVESGADLAELAQTHSDGPSAARGGHLGVYATGTMVPSFERAIASVAVGQLAPLVRSPFGWHIAQREAVIEAQAAHILIAFQGAWRSRATRTREEARERASEALRALGRGTPFAEVASTYSDDARTSAHSGRLGTVSPGQFVPAFEQALFDLEPNTVSDVIETPYGFHIIQRLDDQP